MAPISFKSLQPFKAVRDNWSTLKPYHDNYVDTISLFTVFTAFLGTISLMVTHGFKMPRLHPTMEVEELQPSILHPNEYVTEQDLTEARLFEFEQEQRLRMVLENERERQDQEARRNRGKEETMNKEMSETKDLNEEDAKNHRKTTETTARNEKDVLNDDEAIEEDSLKKNSR